MRSNFSIRTDEKPPEWKRCLKAARWIPRAFDMYCVLDEAIRVSQIVEDAERILDDDLDDEDNIGLKEAYQNIVKAL